MQMKQGSLREYRAPSSNRRTVRPYSKTQLKDWLRPPIGFSAALGDAIAWIAAAVACRIAVDVLLSSSVSFWLPGMLILIAPAVLAISLATLKPQMSLTLGYRLLLVAFGLLIGGRL